MNNNNYMEFSIPASQVCNGMWLKYLDRINPVEVLNVQHKGKHMYVEFNNEPGHLFNNEDTLQMVVASKSESPYGVRQGDIIFHENERHAVRLTVFEPKSCSFYCISLSCPAGQYINFRPNDIITVLTKYEPNKQP